MQLLKALWFINLCFFVLTLIYVWSKILVVSAKTRAIEGLVKDIEGLAASETADAKESGVERAAGSPT